MIKLKYVSNFERAIWCIKRIKDKSEVRLIKDFVDEKLGWVKMKSKGDFQEGDKVFCTTVRGKAYRLTGLTGVIEKLNPKKALVLFVYNGKESRWRIPYEFIYKDT